MTLSGGSGLMPPRGIGTDFTFPDSPVIIDSFASPELRGSEALGSTIDNALYPAPPRPVISGAPSPERIIKILQEEEERDVDGLGGSDKSRAALVLRHALQWGIERGDVDLVSWLASLTGRWASVLDAEVANMEDEEGWGLIGMSVQASCGRQDKEEIVRLAVSRWGVSCGPRSGRDRTGWTPLHLSALVSTPPLISFLLTRGASPADITNRGLTPLDLVAGMPERLNVASLLEQASNQGTSSSALLPSRVNLTEGRQKLLRRRRERVERESTKLEVKDKRIKQEGEREKWVRDIVEVVDVDPEMLFAAKERKAAKDSGIDMAGDSDGEDSDTDDPNNLQDDPFEELVFSPSNLPSIYDTIITSYQPVCQPVSRRGLPANILFLYARFAIRQCGEGWLEQLLEGAVDRIEAGVYGNIEDLAYLAFWAYNTTLLLYLLVSDDELRTACDELGLLGMVEELINAIHVFVIRVAERRIDQVLDAAILDYETLEDFDDVRFEGEWALFRTFGTKKQRASILPKASQVFSDAVTAATNGTLPENGSPSAIFNSLRGKSPFKVPSSPRQTTDLDRYAESQSLSPLLPTSASVTKLNTDSPTRVTDILTGVFVVLHLYDVNPAITVQAFSQVFFWIAAELFNRILSRKKYLCRSKAVQIRMNITALDDWVRLHGLPAKTAGQHFEPVLQLLQWLQTQSTINAFDDLIGTVQGLKRLNPLQMRRAVRDYRFEVNEGRMDEECVSYMGQIQKDWESRRIQTGVKTLKGETGEEKEVGIPGTSIDSLFDGTTNMAEFIPSSGPKCVGELLDSRFMLPFQLPDDPSYLIATPIPDAVYSNIIAASSPFLSDNHSTSRTSFSTTRPFEYTLPSRRKLGELPEDFFAWLKAQEAGRRHSATSTKRPSVVVPVGAVSPPLGPSTKINLANHDEAFVPQQKPHLVNPVEMPPPALPHTSSRITSRPSPTLVPAPILRSQSSIDQLRDKSHPNRSQPNGHPAPQNFRQDSYELRIRQAVNSISDKPENHHPPGILRRESSTPSTNSSLVSSPLRKSTTVVPARQIQYGGTSDISPPVGSTPMMLMSSSNSGRSISSPNQALQSPTGSEGGKKKWWKIGRKEGSGESDKSEEGSTNGGSGKLRRKGSQGTLVSPKTPDGTKRSAFFY